MASFTDYLNNQQPGAAMGGAMAAQSGTSDYGSMMAQLVGNMAQQRMQPQQQAAPQGTVPGGPAMPDTVARGGPQPMGGGGGVNPQMLMQLLGGGGAPQGGMPAPQGMDEYSMGRMIGQMLRQRGGM